MKKHIYTLLFIAFSYTIILAQPGYQGKKNVLKYNNHFSPTLFNYNFNAKRGLFHFNSTHVFSYERTISRKSSLGIQYSLARTSLELDPLKENTPYNIYYGLKEENMLPFKAYYHGFGIYFKQFFSGPANLSPRGIYYLVGPSIYFTEIRDNYLDNTIHNYWGNVGLNFGIGNQVIVFNRIVFDYGFVSQFNVNGFLNTVNSNDIFNNNVNKNQELNGALLEQESSSRLFGMNFMSLKLGIGLLY